MWRLQVVLDEVLHALARLGRGLRLREEISSGRAELFGRSRGKQAGLLEPLVEDGNGLEDLCGVAD